MTPTPLLILTIVPAALLLAYAGVLKLRTLGQPHGLASATDVRALTPRAAMRTAKRLRALPKKPAANQAGVALGQLGRVQLRASWEDVCLVVMAPRTGKTVSVATRTVLDSPGAVIATSNKRDLWDATQRRGANHAPGVELGKHPHTFTFDPQNIVGAPQTFWVDLLADVDSVEAAERLASQFVTTIEDEGRKDLWAPAAKELISALALAAHYAHRNIGDVYRWLSMPKDTTAADTLREHGYPEVAQGLSRIQDSPEKTRYSIYVTASVAARCLRDPTITRWVKPCSLPRFDPTAFVHSHDTLHLLSKDGGGSASPLVAALTDNVLHAGIREAEHAGGRLDPPLVLVLDEAANVCRISDLPKLYSHLGSRNIFPLTILQSYAQGAAVWGQTGIKELWGASTVKLIGPGMDDANFANDLSALAGDRDIPVRSTYSTGRNGRTTNHGNTRRDRILPPSQIRALRKGTALLFATGSKPALIRLQPWYKDKRWKDGA
jgi:type IV secretory pathway TraG/TraD family ATPase VirD4